MLKKLFEQMKDYSWQVGLNFKDIEHNDCIEISTQFLDPRNDNIQIYLSQKKNKLYLSDDKITMSFFDTVGGYGDYHQAISVIINNFEICCSNDGNELYAYIDECDCDSYEKLIIRINKFIQAIISIHTYYILEDYKRW